MSIPHFHTVKIKNIKRETDTCVAVSIEIPTDLKQDFKFQAGQYITFKKMFDGEEIRRSYSLSSSPLENIHTVAIKEVEGGKFSTFANREMKIGDEIEVMSPMGNFTTNIDANQSKHYLAFAAGSGITPIMSLIKTILATEPQSTFTLIFGNQNFYTIIFREELEALKNIYLGRLQVIHILSRERLESDINFGRINDEKCEQLFSKMIDVKKMNQFFMCGPEEMIHNVKKYLEHKGVNSANIHFELFTSDYAAKHKEAFKQKHQHELGKVSMVTIKVDDRSIEIPLAFGGDTILDAALKHGVDLPFACKGGVCCTCRAKVTEGTVEMEANYALEKDEVANGFVLTCQSHPTSEKVVVDFDER